MKVQIAKWGNSAAVRLPKAVLEHLGVETGAELDVVVEGRSVRLTSPIRRPSLDEVVAEMKALGGAALRLRPERLACRTRRGLALRRACAMTETLAEVRSADVVLIRFDPAFGHEQAGMRPGLVVSRDAYNANSSFVVLCPITRNAKPWPFKVPLPAQRNIEGFVLADQLKSIDRRRIVRRLGAVSPETMGEVRALIDLLLVEAENNPA